MIIEYFYKHYFNKQLVSIFHQSGASLPFGIFEERNKRRSTAPESVSCHFIPLAALPDDNHQPEVKGQTHLYLYTSSLAGFQFKSLEDLQAD